MEFFCITTLLSLSMGFSDADWAGDNDDYISTYVFVIYLGRNPVSWSLGSNVEWKDLLPKLSIGP